MSHFITQAKQSLHKATRFPAEIKLFVGEQYSARTYYWILKSPIVNMSSHKILAAQGGFCQARRANHNSAQNREIEPKQKGPSIISPENRQKHEVQSRPNKTWLESSVTRCSARSGVRVRKRERLSRKSSQDNKAVLKPALHYTINPCWPSLSSYLRHQTSP